MKLWSLPVSPFAARVRLSIYRKGLEDRIAIVRPPQATDSAEFRAINPMGRVPTLLLDDGRALPESAILLEYLEDAFPEPSLRPHDAEQLARARLCMRLPDLYFQNAPRVLLGLRDPAARTPEVVEPALAQLELGLSYIDHYLDGGAWAVGDRPSFADSALIPVLNVVDVVARGYRRPDLLTRHPRLQSYWNAARLDPIHARVLDEQLAALPPPWALPASELRSGAAS